MKRVFSFIFGLASFLLVLFLFGKLAAYAGLVEIANILLYLPRLVLGWFGKTIV